MTHTDSALAVARETGWDIESYAAKHEWTAVGIGPVGQHRDSGTLDRSNYAVVLADLTERFPDAVSEAQFGHWGVGWIEEITFDAGNPEVVDAVVQWREALDDYPVADEMAFSELEYAEAVETIAAILPGDITRDGVDHERSDDLPADFAEQIFSRMFADGEDTSPDGMRGNAVEDAALALGFYAVA